MKSFFTLPATCLILSAFTFTSCMSSGKLMTNQSISKVVPPHDASKLKKSTMSIVSFQDNDNSSIYISVDGKMLFKPGTADLDAKGKKALRPLGEMLYQGNEDFSIMIKGVTDIVALDDSKYENNWMLSQARANNLMVALTQHGRDQQKANAKKLSRQKEGASATSKAEEQIDNSGQASTKKYILVLVNSL